MEHIHGSYESTNNFRINPFSRAIINESDIDIVITQFDHNSERFIFEMPKIVEEHDMTLCSAIRIHYINAGSNGKINKDVYEVTDITINEDDESLVKFSWLLSRKVTSLEGVLSFAIQFVCTTDGETDYSWGTVPYKQIKISETYDNSEDVIVDDYSDILEQWKEELFSNLDVSVHDYYTKDEVYTKEETVSVVDKAVAELVDSSPEALNTLNELADALGNDPNFAATTLELIGKKANSEEVYTIEQVDDKFTDYYNSEEVDDKLDANALKASASGKIIRVDDVSVAEHKAVVKVAGKNIFNQSMIPSSNTVMGVTVTYLENEDCFLMNGTMTGTSGFCTTYINIFGEINDLYTATSKYVSGEVNVPSGQHAVGYFGTGDVINNSNNWLAVKLENNDYSVTKELDRKYITRFWFYFTTGVSFNNYKVKIQLEKSDTATEYTPYVDPTTVTITGCGKNLLYYPYHDTTKSYNGITYTDNGDGSITINGTATAAAAFILSYVKNLGSTVQPANSNSSLNSTVTNGVCTFSGGAMYNANIQAVVLNIPAGTTVNNKTLYPQVEYGQVATDYEAPATKKTYTPASDGTVKIDSVSPVMTVFTDKTGVNIDLEYQQDHNKAMNDVRSDISALDDSVATILTDMGDVETALDSIISIQESLIGGESV